jgi:hypothetical protein
MVMDDIIEQGFSSIIEKIEESSRKKDELAEEVRKQEAALLARMAGQTTPLIKEIGLDMLDRGKRDTSGELYDTRYYPEKMIVLGKTEPMAYRPDDMAKKVETQVCVLSEGGVFYELMYSSDGFTVDSYLNRITPDEVLELYGYEIMFMLYRAMREYLQGEKELIDALEKTLAYIGKE